MAKKSYKHFFSHNPTVQSQRTLFDMSKTDTVTINTDYLYPNYRLLICPGDTVVMHYSNVIRLIDSLQVPMMDNLYCDTLWFYVPFDYVWDYTKNFFGEKKRPSDPDISTLPIIEFTGNNDLPQLNSIYDYFEIPIVGNDYKDNSNRWQPLLTGGFSINALPFMSYYLIHDDWVRDEQRVDYLLDTPDFTATTFSPSRFDLYKRGKRFDYFTSTTLEPQIGTPTTISLGSVPVIGNGNSLGLSDGTNNVGLAGSGSSSYTGYVTGNTRYFDKTTGSVETGSGTWTIDNASLGVVTDPAKSGLVTSSALSPVSVEVLRRAFQVQAYKETLNRYGTRYTEYLYSMYGIINNDAEIGRSEFLGMTHQRLSVQPITQTTGTTTAPLGDLGAICYGSTDDGVFTRSFTKFGYIIGLINIYADLTYYQGLQKDYQLRDRMDFPLSIFANLTDTPVYKSEIVLTGTSSDSEVFGYNEIYSWAKYSQNSLRGLVRPNAPTSIGYWSLAEQFASVPVNDDDFITMNTPIDRITSVNSANNVNHFIVNQLFDVKLTRELPAHSDPMKWMSRF